MEADLSAVAALIADPSRATMLDALTGGHSLTAGALARCAGVAPSTATEHIARLAAGGLVVSERRGRTRDVLGAALLGELLRRRWLRRRDDGRALAITAAGRAGFEATFGATLATIGTSSKQR